MWLTLVTSRLFEFEYRHSHSNWMCQKGLYLVYIPQKRRPRILGYKHKSSSGPEVCRGRSRWRWGRRARTRRTGWRTPQTRRPSGRGNPSPSYNRFQLQQKMFFFFRFNSFLGKGYRPILFLFISICEWKYASLWGHILLNLNTIVHISWMQIELLHLTYDNKKSWVRNFLNTKWL